jgi:hypothetical protein
VPGHDDSPLRAHVHELNDVIQRLHAELREKAAETRGAVARIAELEASA